MFMIMKLRQIRILLILVLSFSILPEVVFSQEDIYDKVEIDSTSSEETNSCDEHNCPVLPDEPFHHCAVCCVISHFFTNQLTGNIFYFNNTSKPSLITEDVHYKELFAKTLFRPPQSIL
ncbi:MAG: hypothetical protein MAG551_02262 [Candidatus Scalindua arabica]|uniref:Uncharacterized protein n=1 Tax=Candidatus Scalindua arabica TaxID=1127984 RepID=A0A941W759_9BACT|nr:hypothetical protein [Candidatus Scalindua arabica]